MKKYNVFKIFSMLLLALNFTYGKSFSLENHLNGLRQKYKNVIETKLYESKATSFSKSYDGTIYTGRYSYGSRIKDSSILKTINSGLTWEKIGNFPEIDSSAKIYETIVKVAPNNSNNIFIYFLTEDYEVLPTIMRSNDSGRNFEIIKIDNIVNSNDLGKLYTLDIHFDPNNSRSAYILLNGMKNSKIYKYTENQELKIVNIDSNYFDIIISIETGKQDSNLLYASGFSCFYKSTDSGASWSTTTCSAGFDNSFKKLKIDPLNDDIIYGIPYKLNKSYESEIIKKSVDGGKHFDTKYSETNDSSDVTSQGVTIDIDNSNPNKVLVTYMVVDGNENTTSKIIESLDKGQNWKLHSPDLGTYNTTADAVYTENNNEYCVLLSSLFNLYKGISDENGYTSNWSVLPFKYQ